MSINKYNILSNFPKKEISIENVIDLIYSAFSFELIKIYSFNYLKIIIFDSLKIKNIKDETPKKIYEITRKYNNYFTIEYFFWNILNSKYKKNQNNLLLPNKVYELKKINNIIEEIITAFYDEFNKKITPLLLKKIRKSFFKTIKFTEILPFLQKNHLPPLASNKIYKSYDIKNIKKKNIYVDRKGVDYYLYRKNDIISKFPINYLITGVSINRMIGNHYISINLRNFITDNNNNYLKKRYTGKDNNFNNSMFYLITYYKLYGYIYETGECQLNVPKINNKKINDLYNKAIDLIGTPLSVPLNKKYFGLFPDIEQYFGSSGSFYDIEPSSGIYSIQFPASINIIEDTIININKWLDNAFKNNENLTFMLWFMDIIFLDIYSTKIRKILLPSLDKSIYMKYNYNYSNDEKEKKGNTPYIIYVLSSK